MGGIGDFITGASADAAKAQSAMAAQAFNSVQLPNIDEMKLNLQKMVQVGQLTPVQAQAILQERTELDKVYNDPRLREAQMNALGELQGVVDAQGLDPEAQARLHEIVTGIGTQERGAREAILANARERGIGGSGIELANQLISQQGASSRASQAGFDAAAEANQRKMQAIAGLAQTGGQIRAQDYGEAAERAKAQDIINQFNTQNRQNVNLTNTAAQNAANLFNLQEKQRVADTNVGLTNQQRQYMAQLPQQAFENAMKKAAGISGSYQAGAGTSAALQGQANQSGAAITGAGIQAAASLLGGLAMSDEREKKDVSPFDPEDFLDAITGYKYKYKDKENGKGKQVGIMAQDVEKEAPQMVTDTPKGKMIDYSKSGGPLFAALANINERLKDIENG